MTTIAQQRKEYVAELDVAEFEESELTVEAVGSQITVRGNDWLEEVFRLPNDVDVDHVRALYEHGTLTIHAPRATLERRQISIEHARPRPRRATLHVVPHRP